MRSSCCRQVAIVFAVLYCSLLFTRSAPLWALEPLIELYTATVTTAELSQLQRFGFDVAVTTGPENGRYRVELALSPSDRMRLSVSIADLEPDLWRAPDGTTFATQVRRAAQDGYRVWRSWDEPGGIGDELDSLAQSRPDICQKVVLGHTWQGRELVAIRVTAGVQATPTGERPAVLYLSLQHAREWLTIEVNRRLLHHVVNSYGHDPQVTALLGSTELWFVPVVNPDGYQFTFEPDHRLWRKNLRDNDGDGRITEVDGVDLNRNFASHWGYDEEGSSGVPYSDGYRGPGPASEPETRALQELMDRIGFAFAVNYHSAAGLILYPIGWQSETPAIDHPVLVALAGTREQPAIPGFRPGLSASLYVANGETCDYALSAGTLCFTPELTPAPSGSVFVFPDDEALVEEEFQRNLPFALDVALSAADPANPTSHLGHRTQPFYVDTFPESYGSPQWVQVDAPRNLGEVTLHYRIGDGPVRDAPTVEWAGGKRYGEFGDVAFRRLRGLVQGAEPGDEVTVWFSAAGLQSPSFRFRRLATHGSGVLVVAAEDYTGSWPEYARRDGPTYLDYYLRALAASGYAADVYDVDAHGRKAPSRLGVLSHYRVVVWYTGDDFATALPGTRAGFASRLANEMMIAMRDYLNEGGRLLVAGRQALQQYAWGLLYNPEGDASCPAGRNPDPCISLSDGFARYYLGANALLDGAGTSSSGQVHPIVGLRPPFAGLRLSTRQPAGGRDLAQAFRVTSDALPMERFPQFASMRAARYDRPADRPHSGDYAVYSGRPSYSYLRLTRELDLTAVESPVLRLWVAYELRSPWDALFIEAHRPGEEDWTTLPDANGHTSPEAALNCASPEWFARYPHLAHYMTAGGTAEQRTCLPAGTTGTWNAATGNSQGDWQEWSVDLSAYRGERAEVAVSFVSSRVPYWGVMIDDLTLPDGKVESFETDLGGWRPEAPAENQPRNTGSFARVGEGSLPQSDSTAIVVTADSILAGFDLSSLATDAERNAFISAALKYLWPRYVLWLPHLTRP